MFKNLNSSDIYVLNDENGHERLIPAVSDFVETVNIKEKKISLKIDFDEFSDDEN
jgi:ribosomal 30S subunit maturation factor RimM